MAHHGVRGFESEVGKDVITHGETWFGRKPGFARHGEAYQSNTWVDAEFVVDVDFVLGVDGVFNTWLFLDLLHGERVHFHRYGIGARYVGSDRRAHENAVCGVGVDGYIVFRRVVADARTETRIESFIVRVICPLVKFVSHVGVHRIVAEYE